jgi:predicted glycogen debranching enzyme
LTQDGDLPWEDNSKAHGLAQSPIIDFGPEVCGDLAAAESREWLVTNGIGGYAFGTVAGLETRSYHGLLVAALQPPGGRRLLLAKLDETVHYNGQVFHLAANRWVGGAVTPQGFRLLKRFHLEDATPVWTFALADALLEKRIVMAQGANTTYILYRLVHAREPIALIVKALVDFAAEHQTTSAADLRLDVTPVDYGLRVTAVDHNASFYLLSAKAAATPAHEWYLNFDLSEERARGLRDHADHLFAGDFSAKIPPGESLAIVASTETDPLLDAELVLADRRKLDLEMHEKFEAANRPLAAQFSPAIQQLVQAADQFIALRPLPDQPNARTILAGFPWFSAWGRDTMISLVGLTLVTGRPEIARDILSALRRFVSKGMLPNQLLPAGETLQYNTVDAALWYLIAIEQYFEFTGDVALIRLLFPVLEEIIDAYSRGTRFNIHVDPADGLLYAGEEGVQLTWMDAKIGDWVVTPRIGKPVEVNALWLNATTAMARFARAMNENPDPFEEIAQRAGAGFARFWNPATNFCFDVLDGPTGNEATLRPNQIFAVSLRESALNVRQKRNIVDICARELLTPFGLRSMGPKEPGYHGRYIGGPAERDAAYHQGTAWGWLLGPFALAHLRVYQDPGAAASFLEPMLRNIDVAGLGTLGEIFDGDPPFSPRGCIAQAWTVAETLRAWREIASKLPPSI